MEDSTPYAKTAVKTAKVQPLDDPDFIGAEAAFKRAAANVWERYRAAGLEPVVSPDEEPSQS